MGAYVVTQLVKAMTKRRLPVQGARILVMGLTFKENCPDLRNTRVVDIVKELAEYDVQADVFDPWADTAEAQHEYGITPVQQPEPRRVRRHHHRRGPPPVQGHGRSRHPRTGQARACAVRPEVPAASR
jgi:hypothetical protein